MEDEGDLTKGSLSDKEAYYLVTAYPPTSVSCSVKTNFTDPIKKNLIVAQSTKLTIYDLTREGIVHRLRLDLFGRVAVLIPFQPEGLATSILFVLTEKRQFFTLSYDIEKEAVITKSCGDFSVDFSLSLERGLIARLDPNHRAIFLFLSQGSVKILPLVGLKDINKLDQPRFPLKTRGYEVGDIVDAKDHLFELQQVIDVAILTPTTPESDVVLAVLYSSATEYRSVALFRYNPLMRELYRDENHTIARFCRHSYILLALPNGGILGLGDEHVSYCKVKSEKTELTRVHSPYLKDIQCYTALDTVKGQYLLGDIGGSLILMNILFTDKNRFSSVEFTRLGTITIPSSLCYLDSDYLYVGSHYGNSQLVKLILGFSSLDVAKVEVVENVGSISPILDVAAVDFGSAGLDQVVTCSGGYHEGRLHVLRSGAGYQELGQLDLTGICGLWTVSFNPMRLAIGFLHQTRMLDAEFQEVIVPGVLRNETSLSLAGWDDGIIQVTTQSVLHISVQVDSWLPPNSWSGITAAAISNNMVVVSGGKGEIILLTYNGGWNMSASTKLPHEVACLDMSPLPTNGPDGPFCVVGLWVEPSVYVLQLPSLATLSHAPLPGEMVPRCLLQTIIGTIFRLLVAMADGRIFFFHLDASTGELSHPDCFAPGTQATKLVPFHGSDGEQLVLSVSDKCSVIYPNLDTLQFAYINGRGPASQACMWHSIGLENTILFSDFSGLAIGRVNEVRKLHVRSIPLGEFPCRLAPMVSSRTLAVITTQGALTTSLSKLRLFQTPDLQEIDHYVFPRQESALSLISAQLSGGFYYVVGTVAYSASGPEAGPEVTQQTSQETSQNGSIYLFQVTNQKLHLVNQHQVRGGVHCLQALHERLVASVNGKVCLFQLDDHKRLLEISSHYGNIHVVNLDVIDDQIVVGDLTRSCHILKLDPTLTSWKPSGQDQVSRWITAAHPLTTETILVADAFNNILVMKHKVGSDGQQVVARYHLGDQVNSIVKGSLLSPPGITSGEKSKSNTQLLSSAAGQTTAHDKEGAFVLEDIPFSPVVLGTVSGMVSLINPLPVKTFDLLRQLERNLLHYLGTVGNLQHRVFRAFQDENSTQDSLGFIDGDVVEIFLRLGHTSQMDVIKGLSNQSRLHQLPPLQQVTGLAGGSWRGLSSNPIRGVSYATSHQAYASERKANLMTGRQVYDDENVLDHHQPHPIPVSHTALLHLLNDLSRLH